MCIQYIVFAQNVFVVFVCYVYLSAGDSDRGTLISLYIYIYSR